MPAAKRGARLLRSGQSRRCPRRAGIVDGRRHDLPDAHCRRGSPHPDRVLQDRWRLRTRSSQRRKRVCVDCQERWRPCQDIHRRALGRRRMGPGVDDVGCHGIDDHRGTAAAPARPAERSGDRGDFTRRRANVGRWSGRPDRGVRGGWPTGHVQRSHRAPDVVRPRPRRERDCARSARGDAAGPGRVLGLFKGDLWHPDHRHRPARVSRHPAQHADAGRHGVDVVRPRDVLAACARRVCRHSFSR